MKRKTAISICALLLSSSMLCACGGKTETTAASSSKTESVVQTESASDVETVSASDTETDEVSGTSEAAASCDLADGTYIAEADTDSSMFHINEALDGTCVLTVKDGQMTAHLVLASTGIVQLFQGSSEDAQKDGAKLIDHVTETVTYSDGTSEDVYAFDVPCPVLDEEFPVAILGEKGTWYDHTVIISNPVPEE